MSLFLAVFSSTDEWKKRLKNENFKKYLSDSFPQNLFLLSSERPGFNQAVFTHGEQSQVFTTVMLKVLLLVFAIPAAEMKGVVRGAEVLQSGCLQT